MDVQQDTGLRFSNTDMQHKMILTTCMYTVHADVTMSILEVAIRYGSRRFIYKNGDMVLIGVQVIILF
jgi:hypothetical protein